MFEFKIGKNYVLGFRNMQEKLEKQFYSKRYQRYVKNLGHDKTLKSMP